MNVQISPTWLDKLKGILLILLLACVATWLATLSLLRSLSLSSLVVGIVIGMFFANTLRKKMPATWGSGIGFCAKRILRIGIALYGFRLTFQDVAAVGVKAICLDAIIVSSTIGLGMVLGRLLKMDKEVSLLAASGSAICGAAAVLGVDGVLKPQPYKTAVAVATVVIFGTLSMFLYPIFYRMGVFSLPPEAMGLFTGATVHEVAHVVGAGNAMGSEVSDIAIIVKMIRVMMLVVVLLVVAWMVSKRQGKQQKHSIQIPWFALCFLLVIGFNSLHWLDNSIVQQINTLDTFLLTMAMTALGADTSFDKFKKAGVKPFLLAACLAVWLMGGGYLMVRYFFL